MPTVRQRYRRTDGLTTYESNTALALRAWRLKDILNSIKPILSSLKYCPPEVLRITPLPLEKNYTL